MNRYVLQDDAHYPVLTVKETLQYAAMLRLRQTNVEDVDSVVENTMRLLGIEIIADNMIGTEGNRTISRGQLRRLTIGCEIINSSSLIFLDEVNLFYYLFYFFCYYFYILLNFLYFYK